jgi:hypothetical protein
MAVVLLAPLLSLSPVAPVAPAGADKTFGDSPLDWVLDAAEEHKACGLTRDRLAALVLGPTFRESGAADDEAPSPMTLSRWDTQSALYSFGSTSSHPRAFWHPGISPWQWDDASLQGLTAYQRIDSAFIADFTAEYIADRWCVNPTFAYAWAPWAGCATGMCREDYNEIFQDGKLVNVNRDLSITRFGGMVSHTCVVGTSWPFTCWYIDPARAQGADWWAQPGGGPAPISAPFYSYASGGREYRHWLREDTGYGLDISAYLPLGKNSRTSLTWVGSSQLCDLTRGVGRCDQPPEGFQALPKAVSGSYWPISGDFNGDGRHDQLWYGRGSSPDAMWFGTATGGFTAGDVNVKGTYTPLSGDFNGDGYDDVLWYGPGAASDSLWYGGPFGFRVAGVSVKGTYTPVVGDFTGNGRDDILWYGPGSASDAMWLGRTDGWGKATTVVNGTYTPLGGDFDGDGDGDVFWYGPGTAGDSLWLANGHGETTFTPRAVSVKGNYFPVAGDFSDDAVSDILWYGLGSAPDSLWYGGATGSFTSAAVNIIGAYIPTTGDFDGVSGDDIFLYGPGKAYDVVWFSAYPCRMPAASRPRAIC